MMSRAILKCGRREMPMSDDDRVKRAMGGMAAMFGKSAESKAMGSPRGFGRVTLMLYE